MNCPFCNSRKTHIVDSRHRDSDIRRRRECLECEQRFTTVETYQPRLSEEEQRIRKLVGQFNRVKKELITKCVEAPSLNLKLEDLL